MSDGITESIIYTQRKEAEEKIQKYNSDFQRIDLSNGDFIICPLDGSKHKGEDRCSEKNYCPGYKQNKCPE